MKQADLGLNLTAKRTRKREFLAEMERVEPDFCRMAGMAKGGRSVRLEGGRSGDIECSATAADQHNALVMLVRREGESIAALLKRLDRTPGRYYETGETVDEVNPVDD